jgi:hypothetical protein
MMNRKPWKRLVEEIGLKGSVRGLEVTFGDNGWHPHTHEGLFLPESFYEPPGPYQEMLNAMEMSNLELRISDMWGNACLDAGLGLINQHGVKIQDGGYASGYLSKWGLDYELTKSHSKRGRRSNKTPFDLLRAVRDGEQHYGSFYREYYEEFRGKLQLTWSKGLAELLNLKEISDEVASARVDDDETLYATLSRYEWSLIYRKEVRGELLEVAAQGGPAAVMHFIAKLVGRPVEDRGDGYLFSPSSEGLVASGGN